MGRIRLLHISDLHERAERENEAWRRRRVLGDAWLRHLDELCEEAPMDALLFTGDAADWGQPAEFKNAGEFLLGTLERLGLKKDRLFVIPGNHDVDRGTEADCWKAFRKALSNTGDLLSVARWMSGGRVAPGFESAWRNQIADRLQAYREWVRNDLGRPELAGDESTIGYRAMLEIPAAGYPIHILGLNTAWLCGDDNDAGKLWILDEQLMRLATAANGDALPGFRLLLMHHRSTRWPTVRNADGCSNEMSTWFCAATCMTKSSRPGATPIKASANSLPDASMKVGVAISGQMPAMSLR